LPHLRRAGLRHRPGILAVPAPASLVIATRESALALWQAEHVRDRLQALYPGLQARLLGMTTQGDRNLDTALSKIGGKGLFVKELESALESGAADIAVHSMKDVPMNLPEGFVIAAITAREDPRDAFVSNRYRDFASLPPGSRVGTSSLRRESQLRARFPHLEVEPLRGNVQTRLRKLDEDRYAAIILAAAGLKRLGLGARITQLLTPDESLPAVGQGALGIECRTERADLIAALAPLDDAPTRQCVEAERALSRALTGSCQVPLGGYAEIAGGRLRLRGFVASPDGRRMVAEEIDAPVAADPRALGTTLAERLIGRGARALLDELEEAPQ
jgi:hydroxymethylbilane synthase